MKKYNVHIGYYTCIDVEVEAKNEEEAKSEAYLKAGRKEYDSILLHNLQEECTEVTEV